MATDADVMALRGKPWPPRSRHQARCRYCAHPMRPPRLLVIGAWHPAAGVAAYVVLTCPVCRSTENGGAP